MRALALLIVVAAFPSPAAAQFDSGQISGFVRDAQQGALPGATVTITNEGTSNKQTSAANSTGF